MKLVFVIKLADTIEFTNTSVLLDEGESKNVCISSTLHVNEIYPMSHVLLFLNVTTNGK